MSRKRLIQIEKGDYFLTSSIPHCVILSEDPYDASKAAFCSGGRNPSDIASGVPALCRCSGAAGCVGGKLGDEGCWVRLDGCECIGG